MKKHMRKILAMFLAVCVSMLGGTAWLLTADESHAANGSLTVNAGFYGGPYYTVHEYSDSEMRALSDGTVWTYSGVDSGNFMRVAYAWGVPLDVLVSDMGIDLSSVKFFHMGTSDGYKEGYTTFSAATLLGNRYFYPNFVLAARDSKASNPVIDYNKVDSTVSGVAYSVPTMLAIGCSSFSRDEAGTVLANGKYSEPSASELSTEHQYRLLYGQSGITNSSAAQNVRMSDKWIYEINIQLAGSPDIQIEKKLVSGKEGQKGSKYNISVRIDLPESYGYLDSSVQEKLKAQILESTQISYDSSKVELTDKGNGEYEMEMKESGDTDITASYSRTEYDGTTTTASGTLSIKKNGSSGSGGSGGGSGSGEGGDSDGGDSSKDDESSKGIGVNSKNYQKTDTTASADKNTDKSTESDTETADSGSEGEDGDGGTWAEAKMSQDEGQDEEGSGLGLLGAGLGILFLAGCAETIVGFYRNV